jgi:hypothetical protein
LTGKDRVPLLGPEWRTKITVALDEAWSLASSARDGPIAARRLTQHRGGADRRGQSFVQPRRHVRLRAPAIVGRRKSAEPPALSGRRLPPFQPTRRMSVASKPCNTSDTKALTKISSSAARRAALETTSSGAASRHLYQRNQLPTAPDQKGHDQKDKEARCEQFATGMRGWRKVKTIIRPARPANIRLRCSFSAQSTGSQGKHCGDGDKRSFHCAVSFSQVS